MSTGEEILEFRKRWTGDLLDKVMLDLPAKEAQVATLALEATRAAEEAENQRQIEAMGLSGVERKGVAKAGSYGATDPLNPTGRPRPEKQPTEQIRANRPEPLINKPA